MLYSFVLCRHDTHNPRSVLCQSRSVQEEVILVTRKYETMYILNPSIGEETIQATMEKIQTLFESSATIDKVDVWGKRRLAYEIDDQTEGYYVLINFSSDPEFPKELERVFKITEGVLRYMVVRVDD
ncbi:MAG: 30S ribosomal protein S6 [Clostridiaceae bacterium]|nr:30S ribosomal protein S6 [Clostridiaceae bacterium]